MTINSLSFPIHNNQSDTFFAIVFTTTHSSSHISPLIWMWKPKISRIFCFFNFGNHGAVGELRRNSYLSVLGHLSHTQIYFFVRLYLWLCFIEENYRKPLVKLESFFKKFFLLKSFELKARQTLEISWKSEITFVHRGWDRIKRLR